MVKFSIKILLVLFAVSILPLNVLSQSERVDSLLNSLEQSKQDSSKIHTLNALFIEFEFNDPEKAKMYLRQAFELAILSGYKKGIADCYVYLGYFAQDKSNVPAAINNYNEALKIYKGLNDKKGISTSYNNLGNCYFEYSEYSKALNYFFKGLKIAEELGDKAQISTKLGNIGSVYLRQNDYPKALDYYYRTLRIDEERGDKKEIALVNGNIGIVYTNMKDPAKALEYYIKAKEIDESIDNKYGLATQLDNIGIAYSDLAETYDAGSKAFDSLLTLALQNHQQALKLNKELGNQNRLASCYNNIGTVYYDMYKASGKKSDYLNTIKYLTNSLKINEKTGNVEGVVMNLGNIGEVYAAGKQYEQAEDYLLKALSLARSLDFQEILSVTFYQLSDLYEQINQPERALKYFKRHSELKDNLLNEIKSYQIAELETKFHVEKKEKELELFRKEQILTRYKAYFLAVILLFVSLLAVVLINRQRLKIKRQKEAHDLEQLLARNNLEKNELEKKHLETNLKLNREKLNHITDLFKEKSKLIDKMQEQLDIVNTENAEQRDINQLLTNIEDYISPNEYWEEFITSFNLVNKSFFDQILKKYPELSNNELRLCALIKCNLSNKEIANILNITPDSVKKSRNRLRKRLLLEADDSLTKYIQFLN